MPRPRQNEEQKRQHKITIRLSLPEFGKVTDEVKKLGVSISSYIRAKVLHGYIRIPKIAKIDKEHIGVLSKLGGLLKKIHIESGGVYHPLITNVIERIEAILILIQKRLEEDMSGG